MATIGKPIRLVNPSHKKKRLTLLQKLHFGSKRQRAHAQDMLGRKNPSSAGKGPQDIYRRIAPGAKGKRFKKALRSGDRARQSYYASEHYSRRAGRYVKARTGRYGHKQQSSSRLPNVGEIITVRPSPTHNPSSISRFISKFGSSNSKKRKRGTKLRNMAHRKSNKRRLAGLKAARTRKRRLSARRASHNPGHRRRSHIRNVVYRRRIKRGVYQYSSNRGHRRRHRRNGYGRNPGPGFMSGDFGKAVGIIAGAMVTKFAMGFVPASLASGIPGYIVTALVAALQGKAVGKLLRNPSLGRDMAIGGYVYLALRIAQDYMPSLGLPFGISGLGQIYGPSSFYNPQVPINGSMGQFVLPAAVRGAIPAAVPTAAGMKGLGSMRRVGRMR